MRRARLAATLPCVLLHLALLPLVLLPLAACSPGTDGAGDAAPAPAPRITAEHPVTALPALEAGLLDDGAAGSGPVLGEAGPVDGLAGGGAPLVAVLPADEVAESLAFYTGLLGFDVISSQPAEPPFQRVDLARGGVRLVLLGPEAWEREMPPFGEAPAARGEPATEEPEAGEDVGDETDGGGTGGDEGGGAEADPGSTRDVADGAGGADQGAGPVLRLAVEDLDAVAEGLTGAGLEIQVRDGAEGAPGRRVAVVDPAGNRLLLVPVAGS